MFQLSLGATDLVSRAISPFLELGASESANRLARRKRWPRMKGNDGRVRVSVPEEAIVRRDSPSVSPPDNPVHAQIAKLEGELVGVREALVAGVNELVVFF